MKRLPLLLLAITVLAPAVSHACDVCEKQQPALTRGITHGAGPSGWGDWLIIGAVALIALATLILSIRRLARPQENNPNHIKRSILEG